MMAKAEEICNRITDQFFLPAYSDFKKVNNIDLDDLRVAKSREYKQLSACGISNNLIEHNYCIEAIINIYHMVIKN